jgi:hypothetical protein
VSRKKEFRPFLAIWAIQVVLEPCPHFVDVGAVEFVGKQFDRQLPHTLEEVLVAIRGPVIRVISGFMLRASAGIMAVSRNR